MGGVVHVQIWGMFHSVLLITIYSCVTYVITYGSEFYTPIAIIDHCYRPT